MPKFLCLFILALSLNPLIAQDDTMDMIPETVDSDVFSRLEALARDGRLPDYQDLRLPSGEAVKLAGIYMESMPVMGDDYLTTDIVFADVDESSPFSELYLIDLLQIASDRNFDLINARRDVTISESSVTEEQGFFVPFVDFVSSGRVSRATDDNARDFRNFSRETGQESLGYDLSTGLELRQNLPTGGTITGNFTESRSKNRTSQVSGSTESRNYGADASVRFSQPLLQGSGLLTGDGTDIGTAALRRARISQQSEYINNRLSQRDIYQRVISQYFQILQFKQQLVVSRDAIRIRYRFLDETRIKYSVGRVAESEILRAQIQFLQEVETAIRRQQSLDDARENLLILLGLPLDTPISLVDITGELVERGRFDIPPVDTALDLARNGRMELQRSDLQIESSKIERQLAENGILSELDFDVGASIFDSDDDFAGANEFDRTSADAGLTLRIPLSNRIAERERIKRAGLRYEQSATNRLALQRDIEQEVLQSHRGVLTTEARLTVLQRQVEQARRNLELINGSFEVGFASVTEVRLAQDDLFDAETSFKNAILGYQINISQLYIAMGLPLR